MYRAEFFDYLMVYKDFALLDEDVDLSVDYIAWDSSQIHIYGKMVKTIKSDLVHITRGSEMIFDGYVNAVSYPAKNETQIDLLPLMCAFRFSEGFDAHYFGCVDLANTVYNDISNRYQAGVENYQDIDTKFPEDPDLIIRLRMGTQPSNKDRPYGVSDNFTASTLTEMVTHLLTTYRLVCDASMDMTHMCMYFGMREPTESITIESDLDNVLERSISLGNSYGSINKLVIFRPTSTLTYGTAYYLHKDGTVDTIGNDSNTRLLPVVASVDKIDDSDTWDAEALQKAKDTMQPKAYDNEIDLTYAEDDALVHPADIEIGTLATIYAGGTAYQSLLTGKVRSNHTIKLIFGSVRVDLTKQLLMQRRAK